MPGHTGLKRFELRVESLEHRFLMAADPVEFGAVYIEEDIGSDKHGDTFEISFTGGAPGTQLTRLVIDTDHGNPGFDRGDLIFDLDRSGRGADDAFSFQVLSPGNVTSISEQVSDGGSQLILDFVGFDAGDKIIISIDVDEVEHLDLQETNQSVINEGLDPITSGVEFQESLLKAEFSAPDYKGAQGEAEFRNLYDPQLLPTKLDLPLDDEYQKRDRTAGAVGQVQQVPAPASLDGHVYHDRNNNGRREPGEEGIGQVTVQLIPISSIAPQETLTTVTGADGSYHFDDLVPGTYRVVETQPTSYLDGLDTPGTVQGRTVGRAENPGDRIVDIQLSGNQHGVDYDFGELRMASLQGQVRLTDENGDCFVEGVETPPVVGAVIELYSADGKLVATTTTDAQGRYSFEDLVPGNYTLVEITPPDLIDGGAAAGTVGGQPRGSVRAGRIESVTLGSGEAGVEYNFCEHEPSSISGWVYYDKDGDGQREPGEDPIPDVVMILLDETGNEVGRTTTRSDGSYTFDKLPKGTYTIIQEQPRDWLDGIDTPGTVNGRPIGTAKNPGDRIEKVTVGWGSHGDDYNFGEQLTATLRGRVHTDLNENCLLDQNDEGLAGVRVDLIDDRGNVVQTTLTDAQGEFFFTDVRPGTYSLREEKLDQYFHIGQRAGGNNGDTSEANWIKSINVSAGADLEDFAFCEQPPVAISGYVFQDGPTIELQFGEELPADITELRDGKLTEDDKPLAGVTLELRHGSLGYEILGSQALPGRYGAAEPIRVTTDSNGYYEFTGLKKGNYGVFQEQPEGYLDSLDTATDGLGTAVNRTTDGVPPVVPAAISGMHNFDAIFGMVLFPGESSHHNNFSEIIVEEKPVIIINTTPPKPMPRPVTVPLNPYIPVPYQIPPPIVQPLRQLPPIEGGGGALTWHLSVINAGMPRGSGRETEIATQPWASSFVLHLVHHSAESSNDAQRYSASPLSPANLDSWDTRFVRRRSDEPTTPCPDCLDGIPLAGDFDGDGRDELAVFRKGEWFIDLNANGYWDSRDLWLRLGRRRDQPVTGDWDGDGKDDVGIFGPVWPGDPRALAVEPGLPDLQNPPRDKPKNVPPKPEEATDGERVLQLSREGRIRADLIDHVFHFGTRGDRAIAGDWNGDGIATIGVFRDGAWRLDVDGDGRWTRFDREADFGQKGDQPICGDFNGDGIDEIAFVRNGKVYVDSNRNGRLDAQDLVADIPAGEGYPVAGDWDGDGIDEVALFRSEMMTERPVVAQRPE